MKISCGILPYRIKNNQLEVFLVHPGGPFFARKDTGYWGISKGLVNPNEEYIDCAIREFREETGVDLLSKKSDLIELGTVEQLNKKMVYAWVLKNDMNSLVNNEGFVDLSKISNKVTIKLGIKLFESPEIDKGQFFNLEEAALKINIKQKEFLERLSALLKIN